MAQMRPLTPCAAWCDCFPGFHSGNDGFCLFEMPHVSQERSWPTVKRIDLATPSGLARRSYWEIRRHKAMSVWTHICVRKHAERYSQHLWANATTRLLFSTFDILINTHKSALNKAQFHTVRFSIFTTCSPRLIDRSAVFNYMLSESFAARVIVTVRIILMRESMLTLQWWMSVSRGWDAHQRWWWMLVGKHHKVRRKAWKDLSRGFGSVSSVAGVHKVHDWVSTRAI